MKLSVNTSMQTPGLSERYEIGERKLKAYDFLIIDTNVN